jgi:hypothetical protein
VRVLACINDKAGRLSVRCASPPHVGHAHAVSRSATRRIAAKTPQWSQR